MAWALRMSEQEFWERFDQDEREQLVATYRSQMHRALVQTRFPVKEK